jgi:hypothetical protein
MSSYRGNKGVPLRFPPCFKKNLRIGVDDAGEVETLAAADAAAGCFLKRMSRAALHFSARTEFPLIAAVRRLIRVKTFAFQIA